MKYIVVVNGERIEAGLAEDGAHVGDELLHVHLADVEGTPVHMVTIGREVHRVAVRRGESRGRYTLWIGAHRYEVEALDERTRAIRDLTAKTARQEGPRPLVAPMPGLIVRMNVCEGDRVEAGQGLVVMEAMKMENELRSLAAGVVSAIRVQPGSAVEKGAVLVELAPPR
jgi:pyruvate carboxylase subunit B